MKLLVDTQVFVWLINEDRRLGSKTLQTLRSTSNQLNLSYFSIFEMIIKASIGKLEYNPNVVNDLPGIGIELLFPDSTTLQNYAIFNPDNRDPFDNVLITVAIHENCIFVTSDPKILKISVHNLNLLDATK